MDEIDEAIDRTVEGDEDVDAETMPEGDEQADDGDGGLFDGLLDMSGTGKPVESYEGTEWHQLVAGGDGDVDMAAKGELYVARGLEGLAGDFLSLGHPLLDLGIGFVLITFSDSDGNMMDLSDMTDREAAATGHGDEVEKRAEDAEYSGEDMLS